MWWKHQSGVVDEVGLDQTSPVNPFNVCVHTLNAFMINGNKVTVFLCVAVNDGNIKEETSEKKT